MFTNPGVSSPRIFEEFTKAKSEGYSETFNDQYKMVFFDECAKTHEMISLYCLTKIKPLEEIAQSNYQSDLFKRDRKFYEWLVAERVVALKQFVKAYEKGDYDSCGAYLK